MQLVKEDEHSKKHNTQKLHWHQSYTKRVLNEFGKHILDKFSKEFTTYKGSGRDFRSQVLSPILAQQLVGILDSYSPSIKAGILRGEGEVKFGMATDLHIFHTDRAPLSSTQTAA